MTTHSTSSSPAGDGHDELDMALRYLFEEGTEEETMDLEQWLEARPDQQTRYMALRQELRSNRTDLPSDAIDRFVAETIDVATRSTASWSGALNPASISSEIGMSRARSSSNDFGDESTVKLRTPRISQRFWYAVGGFAAVLAILISGWRIGAYHTYDAMGNQVSTYTTGNGQRATVKLPDGTLASLNVGSRLEVPTNYGTGNRTVTLVGEALFTVVHHAGKAFTVKAGHSTTRVLGTSFVVRHYQTDTATTIAVRDGKVSVGPMVLTAGEQMVVTTGYMQRAKLMNDGVFSFASGVLTLSDMPLVQAIPQLNRWYDVEIRLGDSTLATQGVNGVFKPGSIADVVSILELTFDVRIVREGRILTLYQRN